MSNKELPKERQELVDKVLVHMQKQGAPWQSPFFRLHNAKTGAQYNGVNLLLLAMAERKDPRWMTYVQAQEQGWHVKKGEKGTTILVYKRIDKRTNKEVSAGALETEMESMSFAEREAFLRKNTRTLVRYYRVFNAEQIEKIPPLKSAAEELNKVNPAVESILKNTESEIVYVDEELCFYRPKEDKIYLGRRQLFKNLNEFYGTALHEIAHSTMAEGRVPRAFAGNLQEYAREELRAELASMFLQQSYCLTMPEAHIKNHSAYLKHYISILQSNPEELFVAVRDAQKIVDYVQDKYSIKTQEAPISEGEGKHSTRAESPLKSKQTPQERAANYAAQLGFANPEKATKELSKLAQDLNRATIQRAAKTKDSSQSQ